MANKRPTKAERERQAREKREQAAAQETRVEEDEDPTTEEEEGLEPGEIKDTNVTGDTDGLEEHQQNYVGVTKDQIKRFASLLEDPEAGKTKESPVKATPKSDKKKRVVDADDPSAHSDISKKLRSISKRTPIPRGSADKARLDILVTHSEAHALESMKKTIKDFDDRDSSIFLHGYRLKGEHLTRALEALIQSLDQSVTALAAQTRNIKHTTNSLNEGFKGTKRPVEDKGKGPKKVAAPKVDYMKEDVEAVLALAGTTTEAVFTTYDLSVSQIHEAIGPVIRSIANNDYRFVEAESWPQNLYDLLLERKKRIAGHVGTSGFNKLRKK